MIAVDLLGTIRQSGRYFIPQETTLLDLLAYSGGPVSAPESDEVVRAVLVGLSRPSAGGRSLVFEASFDALMAGEAVAPPLLNGDVVTVSTLMNQRFDWLDGLTIASGVASLTFLILRITELL